MIFIEYIKKCEHQQTKKQIQLIFPSFSHRRTFSFHVKLHGLCLLLFLNFQFSSSHILAVIGEKSLSSSFASQMKSSVDKSRGGEFSYIFHCFSIVFIHAAWCGVVQKKKMSEHKSAKVESATTKTSLNL